MQLLELTLHNYKVHRKKTLRFEPGVVGIVGDNGSGKSSIISAICFLFTGEVETKKSDCLTLGETEGWVKGTFLLNGKEGTLERHLTGSKVSLTYDGVTYNKVSEVNQLWNELLQIDSTIFNNVIVAKQGEIQNLFNDETSVREKIFQKIFMVPPTEKIRSVIWDNYIKVCPPEKPEEDVQLLMTMQSQVANERNRILAEIDTNIADLADEATLRCIADRISFLEKCIADAQRKPEFEEKLGSYVLQQEANRTELIACSDSLAKIPDKAELTATRNRLLENKSGYTRKQSILSELGVLGQNINARAAAENKLKIDECEKLKITHYEALSDANAKLKEIIANKNHLLKLRGHAKCPTCHQAIPDAEEYLRQLMAQEVEYTAIVSKANAAYQAAVKQGQAAQAELAKYEALSNRKQYLEDEISKLQFTHYSDTEFRIVSAQLQIIDNTLQDIRDLNAQQTEISAEIRVLEEKLRNLAVYDGDASIDEELPILRQAIQANKNIQDTIANLQLESGKLEHELVLLDARIATSQVNCSYNKKRRTYLEKLTQVYELFAVNKFPRKLIETYMDNVQSSLSTYLDYFDMPYTVKVKDGFKIRLFDGHKDPLPTVSGGQEMMIGICLRLALHKMFAKAFPIWIIDEGTTHLSEAKKQNYFDLINELRNQRIINQIIIIDHDERLSTVVDQTIQL